MDFDMDTPYGDIGKNIDKYVDYKSGAPMKDSKLMQCCVSFDTQKNKSIMVFSMSHILVDGYGYY